MDQIIKHDNTSPKSSGWRGSREFWLEAAYQHLIETGVEAVKVMPMAKSLGISRTSFYWHFEDREALLQALIQHWREKNTANLISRTRAYAETITEAVLNLFDCWIDSELFDAQLDFAIRNWAQGDPQLKSVLEQNDQERINALKEMFKRFDYDEEQSETRALTIYYTQVGYISMMIEEPLDQRIEKMPTYVSIYTGKKPGKSEIARFNDRHHHSTS